MSDGNFIEQMRRGSGGGSRRKSNPRQVDQEEELPKDQVDQCEIFFFFFFFFFFLFLWSRCLRSLTLFCSHGHQI